MNPITNSFAAFCVVAALLPALRPLARAMNLIDRPGGHKTHHGEVPVVGGLGIFVGLVIALLGGGVMDGIGLAMLAVSGFMVFLGALDDRYNLRPRVRLLCHFAAGVALVYSTGAVVGDLGDLLGTGKLQLGWFALPFTVISLIALVNAFNMLDGLDGLAGTVGLVGFFGLGSVAALNGHALALLLCGAMAGSIAAFLLYNMPLYINRALRTFMGDAGSTLLGFLFASTALLLVQPSAQQVSPALILWLIPIPIFELFASTVRRILKGMSPAQADNGHFHHVLLRAGFTVRQIWGLYAFFSSLSAYLGWLAYKAAVSEALLFLGFGVMFAFWLLMMASAPRVASLLPESLRRV